MTHSRGGSHAANTLYSGWPCRSINPGSTTPPVSMVQPIGRRSPTSVTCPSATTTQPSSTTRSGSAHNRAARTAPTARPRLHLRGPHAHAHQAPEAPEPAPRSHARTDQAVPAPTVRSSRPLAVDAANLHRGRTYQVGHASTYPVTVGATSSALVPTGRPISSPITMRLSRVCDNALRATVVARAGLRSDASRITITADVARFGVAGSRATAPHRVTGGSGLRGLLAGSAYEPTGAGDCGWRNRAGGEQPGRLT